jgi:hypothetical protein
VAYLTQEGPCCGLAEIHKLCDDKTPKDSMENVAPEIVDRDEIEGGLEYQQFKNSNGYEFVVFTDHLKMTKGEAFRKYIKDQKLGSVHASRAKLNPNTGNLVKIYLWSVNRRKLFQWCKKNIKGYATKKHVEEISEYRSYSHPW